MGCKITARGQNPICASNGVNLEHCFAYDPANGEGVTVSYSEYPTATIRDNTEYFIPAREHNFVMYNSTERCVSSGNTFSVVSGGCGKVFKTHDCGDSDEICRLTFDYTPSTLSFDFAYSDVWFSYLYDTSNKAGTVGTPAYYIEDEEVTTSGGSGDDYGGDNQTTSSNCFPCSSFTCTAATTDLKYTAPTDYTGDPDCPHPTLFGFGTTSNKIAFKYDALSTQVPNGAVDFEVAEIGSSTFTDIWNENQLQGTPFLSTTTNNWDVNTESGHEDFQIYDLNGAQMTSGSPNYNNNATTGLRVKFRIEPQIAANGIEGGILGTNWELAEILGNGSGYSVGDTFELTYTHTHTNGSTTNFQIQLRIKGVGSITSLSNSSGFDLLRANDTVNGHTITRVFHTDDQNFQYHVAYLDGNGNNFAKDTQYTSNRAHQITTIAGKGIPDRAILIGKYEFIDKSMQFVTADVDLDAPDIYNSVKQPDVTLTITNGRVTGTTIVDGGTGWNQLKEEPDLVVTAPLIESGKNAELKGTFSNGVLTAVEITNAGSGYDADNAPKAWIRNIYKEVTSTQENFPDDNYTPNTSKQQVIQILNNLPKAGIVPVDVDSFATDQPETYQSLIQLGLSDSEIRAVLTENEVKRMQIDPSTSPKVTQTEFASLDAIFDIEERQTFTEKTTHINIKSDPDRRRVQKLGQRGYSASSLETLRDATQNDQYSLNFLNDSELPDKVKTFLKDDKEQRVANRDAVLDEMTQKVIPEYTNYKENLVETVQGPLVNLPEASTGTKYMMTQFRADPTSKVNLNVTLSMTPVNSGNSHFTCNPPTGSIGGTTTGSNGETIVTSYQMSGLLGPGCQAWSCSGTLPVYHELGRAGDNAARAGAAYGNPFTIT